jgi:cobalt-precorrin-5B (C1)-methyltransferase
MIRLPRGQTPSFPLAVAELKNGSACAGIIKDAGDDPDVTNGALIVAEVTRGPPGTGIIFRAGEGVGHVTRPGLPLSVGEPAINPGPRAMIREALEDADAVVTLSIPGGGALAAKTLNARLGIVGGLSILGTTGIVIPFSCASWIASIHRGIDVARAAGQTHLAAATGSTSEAAVQRLYDLPELALIDMGDFVGGTLKYLRRHPVERLTIAGGFAKLTKLAAGHLDLHSSKSQVDPRLLGTWLAEIGGFEVDAAGAGEILAAAAAQGLEEKLAARVAARARETALATLAGATVLDIVIFDRGGRLIGRAGP